MRRVTPDATRVPRVKALSRPNLPFSAGSLIVALLVLCALAAPLYSRAFGADPYEQVTPRDATPPTAPDRDHLLGTDAMGRDQLSRLLYGARLSLFVALGAE